MTNEKVVLDLELRELVGRKAAKLRQNGQTPGVVYGKSFEPTNIQASEIAMLKTIRQVGRRQPVQIDIDGKKKTAIIKSISRHPATRTIQNVAFQVIRQNEKISTEMPIVLEGIGESEAERAGLVILQSLEQLVVKALPKDLPERLVVSVAELAEEGQHLTVGDITLPKGVEIDTELDVVIASVYEPSALQAANEAAAGDAEDESEVEAEEGGEAEAGEEAEEGKAEGEAPAEKKE